VLATQNPIEQEGTYPLPEAQVDRFMLKLDKIKDYIALVHATREPDAYKLEIAPWIEYGASPRATRSSSPAVRAGDGISRRSRLRDAAGREGHRPDVLRHRVIISYEAEAEETTTSDVIGRILSEVPVP
jgi:MoxR-like ATPase